MDGASQAMSLYGWVMWAMGKGATGEGNISQILDTEYYATYSMQTLNFNLPLN